MTNNTNAPTEWVTVPREVTQAMAKAATDAWLDCGSRLTLNRGMAAARAAIAKGSEAAPPAPEAKSQGCAVCGEGRAMLVWQCSHCGSDYADSEVMLINQETMARRDEA